MSIHNDLLKKIKDFPPDISYLAEQLLKEIDKDKKTETQIQEMLLDEITEIIDTGV